MNILDSLSKVLLNTFESVWKTAFLALGAFVGWVCAEFNPAFPLIIVAAIFIFYDCWTAFRLDRRVKAAYPDKKKRPSNFTSFAFGKTIRETLPQRLGLIFLGYIAEHWVFIHVSVPLSYIITGAICFEQFWSILENEASCRQGGGKLWAAMQKILVDKTERHFDVDLSDFKKTEEEKDY